MLRSYRFPQPISKEDLLVMLEANDVENAEVDETPGGQEFAVRAVGELPPTLTIGDAEGVLVQTGTDEGPGVVWLTPTLPASPFQSTWEEKMNGLRLFKDSPGFLESFVDFGAEDRVQLGARCATEQDAKNFIAKYKAKVTISLPGAPRAQPYFLALEPAEDSSPSAPQTISTCSSVKSLPQPVPSSFKGSVVTAAPPPPTATCPPAPAEFPPLAPGCLRVITGHDSWTDLQVPDGTMRTAYAAIQDLWPGAIFVQLGDKQTAILRQDDMPQDMQVALCPPSSSPIVLPTEFKVYSARGEREASFALKKELLCETLNAYACYQGTKDGEFIFRHKTEVPLSRNRLVAIESGVRFLDRVIRNRKVSFLSVMGKPREGKSTVLGIAQRHFSGDGPPPFRCSNDTDRPCTAGLWVSLHELTQCVIEKEERLPSDRPDKRDPDSVVLLLDSEGLFADEGSCAEEVVKPEYSVRLFTIATVLSSCLIFNNKVSNTVGEDFMAPLARLAALFRGFYERNPWINNHKPSVIYLARDWNRAQSLQEDLEDWRKFEDRVMNLEDHPLSFIVKVFRRLDFATLPKPVVGANLMDVCEQMLLPEFLHKIAKFLDETVMMKLLPKRFEDHYIRHSSTLFQLVSTIVTQVAETGDKTKTWISMDYKTIMSGFVAKAVLSQVDVAALEISTALVERFSFFEVATGPEVPIEKVKEEALRCGLEFLPRKDIPRIRVQGPPQAVLDFLSKSLIGIQHIHLPSNLETFNSTREILEMEQAHKLYEPMRECGHQPETVFTLLHDKVEEATVSIRALACDLVLLVVKMELGHVVSQTCEKMAKEAASIEDLTSTLEEGLLRLDPVASRFQTDLRVAEAVSGSRLALQNVQQQILERPVLLIQRVVEGYVAAALGLSLEAGSELQPLLETVAGKELFDCCPTFESVPPQLAALVTRATVSPEEPRYVRELPPDEVERLTAGECDAGAQKLCAEQQRRLRLEMLRLAGPLRLGDAGGWAEGAASKMLELSAMPFDEDFSKKLLLLLLTHLQPQCDGSSPSMTQLSDVQHGLLESPPSAELLGRSWAEALQQAMQLAFKSLQKTASEDFQVALLAKTAEDLHRMLLNRGNIVPSIVELMSDKELAPDGRTWFLVMLQSQDDLETLVQIREKTGVSDLQEMGIRPLRPVWVCAWSDAALRCYGKFILHKKSKDLLYFDPGFEAEEANLYPVDKDSYPCQNEMVEIRPRQSLLFHPVGSMPPKAHLEAALPGLRVVTSLLLGETLVVVADLTRALKLQLNRAQRLALQGGKVICQLSSDWVWSHETGSGLVAEWAKLEAEELKAAKSKVEAEIRREGPKSSTRAKDWVAERLRAHLAQEGIRVSVSLTEQLQACSADFELVWLDLKCEQRCQELAELFQWTTKAQDLAFDTVEHLKPSELGSLESSREEELLDRAMEPLLASMTEAIQSMTDQQALGRIAHLMMEPGPVAELWRQRLSPAAAERLAEVVKRERVERVVQLMGVPQNHQWYDWLVGQCLESRNERHLCRSFYWCNARHFIPEEMLSNECPEVVEVVKKFSTLMKCSAECRVPESLVADLPESVRGAILAHYGHNRGHLLLENPDTLLLLLERPGIGFDLVRTMVCYLRTRLSAAEAHEKLDPWRRQRMFVKQMYQENEWTVVELQMWHTDIHKLLVPNFELKHMSIVEQRQGCGQAKGAYPVSPSSAVFYANVFGSKEVAIPPELLSHAKTLMPPVENYIAPAAVPDEQVDGAYLVANFPNIFSGDSQEVAAKDWNPAGYQALSQRFREEKYREAAEALRVVAMIHTLSMIKQEGYLLGNDFKALPKPLANRRLRCGSTRPSPRFPQTTVLVSNVDSVTSAQHAVQKVRPGEKVLLLNMANRRNPGGGYAKGSSAQEEDIFRRTTLCVALVEALSTPSAPAPSYPLGEFEPVISTGIVGFRGPEEDGFPFIPPFKFDVITVAAYNANVGRAGQAEAFQVVEGDGPGRHFSEEGFWRTFANIYGMLEAAAEHGATHLILSALGCGAFKNPPAQVARIFKQLLQHFAGCFQTVEFAVVGDNYAVFNSLLPGVLQRPKEPVQMLSVDNICPKLAQCKLLHHGGCAKWHPRWCEDAGTCPDHSEEHLRLARHKQPCPDLNCKVMFGPDNARQEHSSLFSHPEVCRTAGCRDPRHLHPPRCSKGAHCKENGRRHADGYFYSHDMQDCPHGTFCRQWADPKHVASFQHPWLPPCQEPAYCPLRTDEGHCLTCSHICELGSDCPNLDEPSHTKYFLHLLRPPCPEGANCRAHRRANYEDHLEIYQHAGLRCCRPLCSTSCLLRQRAEHLQQRAHGIPEHALPVCAVWGHNSMRNLMETGEKSLPTHFHRNAKGMIERVRKHFGCEPNAEVLQVAIDAFASWRPVHRMKTETFSKVATSGFLASLHCLQTPGRHTELAMQLPSVFKLMHERPERKIQVQEAVAALLNRSQLGPRQPRRGLAPPNPHVVQPNAMGGLDAQAAFADHAVTRSLAALQCHFDAPSVEMMKQEVESFLQSMRALEQAARGEAEPDGEMGIGHENDRVFETNKMVFAIYGPHTLAIYGEDKNDEFDEGVHLVLQNLAIYHPDSFLTPMCATFYKSGHGDADRPWWLTAKQEDSFASMHSEKLHPSSPLCFTALAYEFLGRAAHKTGKRLSDVSYEDMLHYWKSANAHWVVECHLPYVTPLTFVEKVIMSLHTFNKLEKSVQDKTKKLFAPPRLDIVQAVPKPDAESEAERFPSAVKQWEAATSQIAVKPIPAFHFTLMAAGLSQAVLPLEFSKKTRVRLFFMAQVPVDPHTFELSDGQCKFQRRQTTQQSCATFNRGLASATRPVMYCLEWGQIGGRLCLRLSHTGSSQLLNMEEVKVTDVASALTCIIFSAQGPPAYFTNVRLHLGEDDTYLFEHERNAKIPPPPRPVAPAPITVGFQDSGASDPLLKRLGKAFVGFFAGSNTKPLCPDGLGCKIAYQTKAERRTEEQQRHLAEYRHLCIKGQTCPNQDSDVHKMQWVHLEKPVCPSERCTSLCDLRHRAEYHHPQFWDLLMRCRHGALCSSQGVPEHCRQYHHLDVHYTLDERGLHLEQRDGQASPEGSPRRHGGGQSSGHMDVDEGHRQPPRQANFLSVQATIQDTMEEAGNFYTDHAKTGDMTGAQFDRFGNPIGGGYDLAVDGSYRGFRMLVGCFYDGEGLPADLQALTLPELHKKGWTVDVSPAVDDFTNKLSNGQYHVAWVLSSPGVSGNAVNFVAALRRFHASGRGLMIWGDNAPYFSHANLFLKEQFGFELMGNTPGGTELMPGDGKKSGTFGKHLVTTGLQKLHEGITICYPSHVPEGWEVFGTSSNQRPVLIAKDATSTRAGAGRVVVDNGFTKLMKAQWTTAGTPRYVSNCAAWLAFVERFRGPQRGFQPPPRG